MKSLTRPGKTCQPHHIPNNEKIQIKEIQTAYDEIAHQYEKRTWLDQHILGVARQRRQLMSQAHGKILDVACGTGSNFPFFPETSEITASDLSPRMLELAQQKASALKDRKSTRLNSSHSQISYAVFS